MNTMTQDTSTGLWNSKNRKIFFWSILALAMILRCIRFATVPDGINQDPPFRIETILPPEVPAPLDECTSISTNDAALWSLDAIYMQEVIPVDGE